MLEVFEEVESRKVTMRPNLLKALAYCEVTGSCFVSATMDRMTADVSFLRQVIQSDVEFLCCDMPEANKFVLCIMCLVAEYERDRISDRTKKALAQSSKPKGAASPLYGSGKSLENGKAPLSLQERTERQAKGRAKGTERSCQERSQKARKRLESLTPILMELRTVTGNLDKMAESLNMQGIKAPRGGLWQAGQVSRMLQQLTNTGAGNV